VTSAPRQQGLDVAAAVLGDLASLDQPLGGRTTYRSGGSAAILVEVNDEGALAVVAEAVRTSGLDVLVIGNGSNLLISDRGFPGIVVALGPAFDWIHVDASTISAGGAVALPVLARRAGVAGRPSLAWAVGIPGSVGGAVAMNAGGHGSDTASALLECRVADLSTGEIAIRRGEELDFSYRHSALGPSDVVLEATFDAPPGDAAEASRSIEEIVRWRRVNQPGGRNAGSVFQNPDGDSAGRIIDELGLKGFRVGSASVSDKHANFIQLDAEGSSDDVAALIAELIAIVEDRQGIRLVPEVRQIGFR
jgi:UDP-N-acetylmuramate dehydrogenase